MNPIAPNVEGRQTVMLGESQPEYETLPAAVMEDGLLYTKWELTEVERKALADGAPVELWVWTFGKPFQPVALTVEGVVEVQPDSLDTNGGGPHGV